MGLPAATPPAAWSSAFLERSWDALPYMGCTELVTLLYGVAGLNPCLVPEREWLVRAELEWLQHMDRSGVSTVRCSGDRVCVSVLRVAPPEGT